MLDLILLLIVCSIIFLCFLLFIPFAIISIDIIRALFEPSKRKSNYQSHENQLVKGSIEDSMEDSINDSEGDGLMLLDDPLFPPEFDDD